MDLTTLAYLVVLGLGLLGTDAVLHHNSVLVEVSSSPKTDKITVDEKTLTTDFKDDIDAITKTVSLQSLARPEIQSTGAEGVGMALATAFHLQSVAYALQSQFDVRPDRIRFALLIENGELRGFVGGQSARLGEFHRIMAPKSGEKTMQFVHRCALWAAGQLAPYSTALFLLKRHAADGNFDQVVAIAKAAEAMLPPTPRTTTARSSTTSSASSRCSRAIRKRRGRSFTAPCSTTRPIRCRFSMPPSPICNWTTTGRQPTAWKSCCASRRPKTRRC